ncbi:uncharacterized protein LOC111670230 [Seriola lalandi dorsalis]|uniref:Uncharacterized LOC111670230 n=1 Tax=Seriola lalandi dorsalis TaxID=1841481 RepID=A0A3B4X740_SERLL|nr:uncharacterized protein LOC111670230 [Seriola lalandi dorsalis]
MASYGDDTIETAALGRPFQLGMLYDCRKDVLIPGITLWDLDQLQNNTSVQTQHNTEFNVTTSDSIEEKSNLLKISGSLKLSLLGGLVNVGGSAKYFQDTKKSHKQARMTLQYKTTTKFETLTMSHLAHGQVSHPNVFEDNTATHVVTAILYGAGAYFVFDRESSSEEDKKQVEGEANLTFNKLKFLTANAEASLNMNEEEKAAVEKFSCTFHGDFKLPSNPTSFSDAVSVYRNLPNMLGENGEHAVPLRVWLYPLVRLDSRAARLQRDISNALIRNSSETIEILNQTEMRCSDILKDTTATTFPAVEKKVQDLMQMCKQYKLDFMQKLGSVLPSIRGGGKEESTLEDILKAHEKSPFNSKDMDQWLKTKGRESDTLKSFMKRLEKVGVKMDDKLDDLLSDLDVRNVVCFAFTSVDQPDSFLVKLSNHLKPAGMVDTAGESSDLQTRNTEWLSTETRQTMRTQLQLFEELKKLSSSDDTKFISASKYDGSHPGACIFIYEEGSDEPVCFVPPSKPSSPTATAVSHDSITVRVSEPASATVENRVEYRIKQKQDPQWASQPLKKNKAVTLSGLKPDTEYEIRATAVGKLSYAVSSDVCSAVTFTAAGPPTQVKDTEVKKNSITLTWSVPSVQKCESVKGYIIEFKEEKSNEWQSKKTGTEVYTFTLTNLKQDTIYSIRMCTDVGVGVSLPGEELKIKTKKEPLEKKKCTVLPGDPPVYLLNLKPAGVRQFNKKVFGKAPTKNASNKTIMVVGATGSGKTTLINGMINYILRVDWDDNWRFKLINEETNKTQACSQTSEVTAYQIYHTDGFQVPYSLTIIDTPGFGDTRGIKQDKEITEKIREFFSVRGGIDSIDAVCFVVQSALARLTHTQRYIFDAILSIFGKDIASNIMALVTFADGKSPPVLEAIKAAEIPCARNPDGSILHFKFNNSVVFAKNTGAKNDEDNFDQMFWKMGKVSMKTFFTHLTTMQPQSLTLTKEVLQERQQLGVTVEGVQPMIRKGLSKLEEINNTKAALKNHETHMKENEDFEYEVPIEKSEKINIEPGKFVTNCHGCNYTCHYPCKIPRDEAKIRCSAMKNGNCTVCTGKCPWTDHFNMTYRWDTKRVTEKRTYQELKSEYEAALGKKMTAEKIIKQLELEYEQVQGKVVEIMGTLIKCLKRLREIALHPDPLSTPDYIDLLIQTEEHEAKPGFKQRIKELQSVREGAVLLKKVVEGIDLTGKEKSRLEKMKSNVKGIFNNVSSWFSS